MFARCRSSDSADRRSSFSSSAASSDAGSSTSCSPLMSPARTAGSKDPARKSAPVPSTPAPEECPTQKRAGGQGTSSHHRSPNGAIMTSSPKKKYSAYSLQSLLARLTGSGTAKHRSDVIGDVTNDKCRCEHARSAAERRRTASESSGSHHGMGGGGGARGPRCSNSLSAADSRAYRRSQSSSSSSRRAASRYSADECDDGDGGTLAVSISSRESSMSSSWRGAPSGAGTGGWDPTCRRCYQGSGGARAGVASCGASACGSARGSRSSFLTVSPSTSSFGSVFSRSSRGSATTTPSGGGGSGSRGVTSATSTPPCEFLALQI